MSKAESGNSRLVSRSGTADPNRPQVPVLTTLRLPLCGPVVTSSPVRSPERPWASINRRNVLIPNRNGGGHHLQRHCVHSCDRTSRRVGHSLQPAAGVHGRAIDFRSGDGRWPNARVRVAFGKPNDCLAITRWAARRWEIRGRRSMLQYTRGRRRVTLRIALWQPSWPIRHAKPLLPPSVGF